MATTESITNRAFRLRQRPVGEPGMSDLELVEEQLPPLEDGEALVRTLYLSLDPTNRLWMSDMRQYSEPVELGAVMRGIGIAEVVESRRDDMRVGSLVSGYTNWQEYCVAGAEMGFNPLPDPLPAPLTTFLGRARPHGHDRLRRARVREAAAGRDRGDLRRRRRRRLDRRPDREGARRPRGWHRGRRGEVPARRRGAWLRRLREPQDLRLARAARGRHAGRHRRATSRTSAARSWTRCSMRLNFEARVSVCGMISQYDNAGAEWKGAGQLQPDTDVAAMVKGFIVSDHLDISRRGRSTWASCSGKAS